MIEMTRILKEMLQKMSDDEADRLDLDKSVVYAERDESEPLFQKVPFFSIYRNSYFL